MSSPISLPSTHPALAEFREMARGMTARFLSPPLKKILAVGMDYDAAKGIGLRDRYWLRHLFEFCCKKGIAIDPDFELVPFDLDDGHDFLATDADISADILMCCFVPSRQLIQEQKPDKDVPGWRVSPRHSSDAWKQAAKETGARLVVTYRSMNDGDEISARDFESARYMRGPHRRVTARRSLGGLDSEFVMETLVNRGWQEGLERLVSPKAVEAYPLRHRL